MEYLKLFDTKDNYLAYRNDKTNCIKPNVSLCDDKGKVYYNYHPDFNGHDYVDLGLPSGTLWATMNVGASKPTDGGLYFQWGDTQGYTKDQVGAGDGKKKFYWPDYKWNPSGDGKIFTKYATKGATLELEDDAANANMGGDWHMPTDTQIRELLDNTTSTWTTLDGVSGMTFTSTTNGKSIFIPAAGDVSDGSLDDIGDYGYVWLSMLSPSNVRDGQFLSFDSEDDFRVYYGYRSSGFSIRGVIG